MSYIKLLAFIGILFLAVSCENNSPLQKFEKERDSLVDILQDISKKYVFDSVKLKTIVAPENILEENKDYNVSFYFIGYNKDSFFKVYGKKRKKVIIQTLE